MGAFLRRNAIGYLVSIAGVAAVALALWPLYPELRGITAATTLLIVVLLVALTWGTGPALLASVLGAVYVNFFYVPPTLKFQLEMAEGDDFIALVAFLVTSILVGQLSSRAQERTHKIQELYDQLRDAFDQASQMEAIKQSERLKSSLLDSVTHDLRTPLTSIKTAATALVDVRNSDPHALLADRSVEKLLGNIVQQSDRLSHFIEGMIELAQIESGGEQGHQQWEPIPMEEIIGIALTRAEDVLQSYEVRVECEEDLNAAVSPKAIAQVLFSLLENAGGYAPPATTVRVFAQHTQPGEIQIAVEDEGPGVPPHLREKVFDKFFRSNATEHRKERETGLGLGLAIARGIIEVHGGKIWVEDRGVDKFGARFVFTLPAKGKAELEHTEFQQAEAQ